MPGLPSPPPPPPTTTTTTTTSSSSSLSASSSSSSAAVIFPSSYAHAPPAAALFSHDYDDLPMEEILAMCELAEAASAAANGGLATAPVSLSPPVPSVPTSSLVVHPPAPSTSADTVQPPTPSIEALFEDVLGLPAELAQAYRRRGVAQPYNWQYQCLRIPGIVSEGRNLLYSAPTSGGKSLVADVLLLRRAIRTRKKVLIVLPFVAVVREKVAHFKKLLMTYNARKSKRDTLRIRAFHGGTGGRGFGRCQIGVCTIEKANALVNKMIQEETIGQLSCLVVDELHMMADQQRGYLLELLLSKLKFLQQQQKRAVQKQPEDATTAITTIGISSFASLTIRPLLDLQIIGLSATLPNLEEVAGWMDAAFFHTTFRPVQLQETYKLGDGLYTAQGSLLRQLRPCRQPVQDPDHIVTLVEETTSKGHQVLVFCHYRKHCESCAALLAEQLGELPAALVIWDGRGATEAGKGKESDDVASKRQALLDTLRENSPTMHPCLMLAIPKGIGIHHAGLADYEKDALEEAFRQGVLSVIVATSSLGTGINLPAARVIFRSLRAGANREFEISSYRQMAGRAGRAGKSSYGESILLLKQPEDVNEALRLMTDPLPRLKSCLNPEMDGGRALVRAILEAIASGVLRQLGDLDTFLHCMLAVRQRSQNAAGLQAFLSHARSALCYLVEHRIVEEQPHDPNSAAGLQKLKQEEGENYEGASAGGESVSSAAAAPAAVAAAVSVFPTARVAKQLAATKLGHALFQSSFAPDEGLLVFQDLKRARMRLVLDSDLHLLYLVTPVFHGLQPDFNRLWNIYDRARRADPVKALVFELVGLDEAHFDRWSRQPPSSGAGTALGPLLHIPVTDAETTTAGPKHRAGAAVTMGFLADEQLAIMRARRLWGALALHDLVVSECSLDATAAMYQVDRGSLQALQQSATSYAGMVKSFLTQLDWTLMVRALENAGIAVSGEKGKELVSLMQIPRLELSLARALYNADVQTVAAVASEPVEHLADIVRKVRPFTAAKSSGNKGVEGGVNQDELAFYDEAAHRLRDVAQFVLTREEKHRKTRLEQLQEKLGNEMHDDSTGERVDPDSSSDSGDDVATSANVALDNGIVSHLSSYQSTIPFQSVRFSIGNDGGGTGSGLSTICQVQSMRPDIPSKTFFETPVAVRKAALRPEDYPLHLCVRTPTRTPSSPGQYLYIPQVPSDCSDQQALRLPAHEVFTAPGGNGARGRLQDGPRGVEFVPEGLLFPSACVSAAESHAFSDLTASWSKASCYSLMLHFRSLPSLSGWDERILPSSSFSLDASGFWRYATKTTPYPVMAGKRQQAFYNPRDENVILCGVAISLDGRRSTYCWLPPPFSPRPFERFACLGDEKSSLDGRGATIDSGAGAIAGAIGPAEATSNFKRPYSAYVASPAPASLQTLPEKNITLVFSFLGYAPCRSAGSATDLHGGRGLDSRQPYHLKQQAAPHLYSNPAMLICRRWNRIGCAWFNKHVSLRGWERVKWLLAQQGPVKILWDAPMVLAALRERNIMVAGPLEDPKVGLALLGQDRLKSGPAGASHSGPLQLLELPPGCEERHVELVAAQAAGLLQLGAAVEEDLAAHQLLEPFRLIEMPLAPVLAEMQFYGMRVDRSWFPGVLLAIQERLLLLQDLADAFGGFHLNLNCQDSVHHLLYVALRLPPPAKWSKKTNVWGGKGHSNKTVLGPVQSDWLESMTNASPAVKIVLEWRRLSKALQNLQKLRSCTRLQPLLGSHRVRCRLDQCGTATGRIILSEPAMQQVAHEVTLRQTVRDTIQDEVESQTGGKGAASAAALSSPPLPPELFTDDVAAALDPVNAMPTENLAEPPHRMPTRQSGLAVAAVRADSYLWANASTNKAADGEIAAHRATSQFGTLRCILSARISEPFMHYQLRPLELTQEQQLLLLPPVQSTVESTSTISVMTLADYWRSRGFNYSNDDAARIRQCVVEFPPGVVLTYPADKVFRRPDIIRDPQAIAQAVYNDIVTPAVALSPRNAFIAPRGCLLLSADYSQIELHILAHFSKDPLLCEALNRHEDVFRSLAASWKRVSIESVTPTMRDEAKQLAYAVLYGQSVTATAQLFAISTVEADKLRSSFLGTYPGIRSFIGSCKDFCRAHGYVETLLGRRRYLPGIQSSDAGDRAQAERQSVNSVCQGSAADLIKLAMVNIYHELERLQHGVGNGSDGGGSGGSCNGGNGESGSLGDIHDCRLVLQIHDELLFEVKESMISEIMRIVKRCMEGAICLKVPLKVNLKIGPSWGALVEDKAKAN
ncbi:dna polymerase theta [Nannochloropsis oceanica]